MSAIDHSTEAVVIIGSGAGGGTLAYELTKQGIECVPLEAGPYLRNEDYMNLEWAAFDQMAWTDTRTTSGSAYSQGEALYKAVGATSTHRTVPYPSTHNLGTCRMSERPEDGVVDTFGRAHDVPNLFISDGSQFTTGAAANPTLTIVALAIRQAEHLAVSLRAGTV